MYGSNAGTNENLSFLLAFWFQKLILISSKVLFNSGSFLYVANIVTSLSTMVKVVWEIEGFWIDTSELIHLSNIFPTSGVSAVIVISSPTAGLVLAVVPLITLRARGIAIPLLTMIL